MRIETAELPCMDTNMMHLLTVRSGIWWSRERKRERERRTRMPRGHAFFNSDSLTSSRAARRTFSRLYWSRYLYRHVSRYLSCVVYTHTVHPCPAATDVCLGHQDALNKVPGMRSRAHFSARHFRDLRLLRGSSSSNLDYFSQCDLLWVLNEVYWNVQIMITLVSCLYMISCQTISICW